jgi:hypothetical protein
MALFIEYGSVLPMRPDDPIGRCECCGRDIARWVVKLIDAAEAWCAKCFLYKTEWAKTNADSRDSLIVDVQNKLESSIVDDDGTLTDDGADRIMMSVVMISAYRFGIQRGKSTRS